jgi:HAD superfamily hydrolase (TIGR01509 family)
MAATALLFDLDGTVWDSFPCYGLALSERLGLSAGEVIELLHKNGNVVGLARGAGLSNHTFSELTLRAINELRLYPNVIDTLQELSQQSIPIAIVTNLPKWLVSPLLFRTGLSNYFGAVETVAGKPSGKGLTKALKTLGVRPSEEVFYVGDLANDAQAANAAGVSLAWASYGYGTVQPKSTLVRIDNFSDIMNLL